MTYEAEAEIEDLVIAMFNKAIVNPDNFDATEVDGINWSFVDADIHMDVQHYGLDLSFDLDIFIEGMIDEWLEFGEVKTNGIAA